jgi:hypothetical protein
MTTQVLRTIAAGILAGIALFMIPFFLIRVLIFFLLLKGIFRLLGWRRRPWGMRYAYAHNYRNMNEEERKAFMEKYGNRCGCYNWEKPSESPVKD